MTAAVPSRTYIRRIIPRVRISAWHDDDLTAYERLNSTGEAYETRVWRAAELFNFIVPATVSRLSDTVGNDCTSRPKVVRGFRHATVVGLERIVTGDPIRIFRKHVERACLRTKWRSINNNDNP